MAFLIGGANTLTTGDLITNSLRLSKDSATYIYKDFDDTGTLNTKGTFSWWTKIYQQSGDMYMMSVRNDASPEEHIHIRYQNPMLQGQFYQSSSQYAQIITNNYFRDHSAWYHFVLKMDSTDGTANNRIRLFVNNQEVSYATQTMPSQNQDFIISKVATHQFGNHYSGTGSHFDGGIAYVHFIDGQAKDPTDFGETNDNGVWIPKEYEGTYGDHGYKLEFKETGTSANASGIGADTSGNGNHFACNSLVALDITTDTPQNNFCTLNSVANSSMTTLAEGNLKGTGNSSSNNGNSDSTFAVANGKWYVEMKCTTRNTGSSAYYPTIGVAKAENLGRLLNGGTGQAGNIADSAGYEADGNKRVGGTTSSHGSSLSDGNIVQVALDMDNGAVYFGVNGTWQASSNPESGSSKTNAAHTWTADGRNYMFGLASYNSSVAEMNFGNPSFSISSGNADANGYGNFEYAVPSGYYSLCTKNLAEYG